MDKNKIIERFKRILKDLRTEKGLSQDEFAKELGISKGAVSYYETGQRVPDIVVLSAIADYFEVSTDFLLGRTETKSVNEDVQAACKVTGLSEEAVDNLKKCCCKMGLNQILIERDFQYTAIFLQNVIESESVFILTAKILDFFKSIATNLEESELQELRNCIGSYISHISSNWLYDFTKYYNEPDFNSYCHSVFLQLAEYIDLREYYAISSFTRIVKEKRENAKDYSSSADKVDFLYNTLSESKELSKKTKALILEGLHSILYSEEGD